MKAQSSKKGRSRAVKTETDSVFFLKLVIYIIMGAFWIRIQPPMEFFSVPITGIPVGLLLGLLLASHDHFQIDRKIEYTVLILVVIVSYFFPTGIIL